MNHQTNTNAKKNLVIIGGGFAGAVLASKLEKSIPKNWEIYLLSQTNFVTYSPLLPEVVGASVLPGHVQAPLRQIVKRTRIRMVTVYKIDFDAYKVYYHNDEQADLTFDQLVFATGVQANTTLIPGMKQYSLPLKTVGDALFIRNRIIECLEQATIHPDENRRKMLTTFIIIGGGFSGVEIAGELDDFLKSAVKYYKNVDQNNCKIILIHDTSHLLPELSLKSSKKTELQFSKRGINVRLNTQAATLECEKVILHSGESIEGATIISTIGTRPHAFIQNKSLPLNKGKIVTQPDMSVSGIHGVWALGDCALVPNTFDGKFCPPTAQAADRQARAIAKNIIASINGKPTRPFRYKPIATLASTGHNKAVAEIYGVRISGFIAFLMWRGIYLLKMPTLARKVRIFLEWNWAMCFPPDIAHLGFKRTED